MIEIIFVVFLWVMALIVMPVLALAYPSVMPPEYNVEAHNSPNLGDLDDFDI